MKKSLLVTTLTAVSALALAGCAKTISYEEAKKHCDENYTSNEVRVMNAHTKDDVKKAEGVAATLYKVGVTETDKEVRGYALSSSDLALWGGDQSTYELNGKALTIKWNMAVKDFLKEFEIEVDEDDKVEGSVYTEFKVDEAGFPVSSFSKIDISFEVNSSFGLSVSGALTGEQTVTYSAK